MPAGGPIEETARTAGRTQMFGVHYMPVWTYTLTPYLREIEGLVIKMFDNRVQDFEALPEARTR